jgi:hypothetical protein
MAKTTTNATTSSITDVTTKVTKLLTPLNSEDRQRVMKASLTLLGEDASALQAQGATTTVTPAGGGKHVNPKVTNWMKANALAATQLDQVFDGGEVIDLNVPGRSAKEKTINTYVIEGIASLLATGEPSVDDKKARELCSKVGCFNSANHSVYMGQKGNVLSGSKASGWRLTGPGLSKGANLVKEMTKG